MRITYCNGRWALVDYPDFYGDTLSILRFRGERWRRVTSIPSTEFCREDLIDDDAPKRVWEVLQPCTDRLPAATSERVSDNLLGLWTVHGGSLMIRADGTAEATGELGPCGDDRSCFDVKRFRARMAGESIRLEVRSDVIEDDRGRKRPADEAGFDLAQPGDVYLLTPTGDRGIWTTRWFDQDGDLRVPAVEANQLGNPYLCRPKYADIRCGV